jgi:hypothetical protein
VNDQEDRLGIAAGGILATIVVAAALVPLRDTFGNTNMALVLVVVIVAAAALGGRLAGILTSVSAALSYNFFHTQPYLSLKIDAREDVVTVVLLLVVGIVVGELANLRSRSKAKAVIQAAGAKRLEQVAALAAAGTPLEGLWPVVRDGITDELGLKSCRFEPAPYLDQYPTLARSGRFDGAMRWTPTGFELPAEGAQLVLERDGRLLGRLVLEPTPGHGVSVDERRVAIGLADQLTVELARAKPLQPLS